MKFVAEKITIFKEILMKKNIVWILFAMVLMTGYIFAQDADKKTTVTKDKKVKIEKKSMMDHSKMDSFVMKAHSGGMMEVELGRYAKDNANSEDVKNFGDMMVTDHSKANDQLNDILKKENMNVGDKMMAEHQKNYNKFSKMKGVDFDKQYMKMMVADHKKDIKEFEMAVKNEKNTDVKKWAEDTLPTLKKHLQKAEEIEKNLMSHKTMKTEKKSEKTSEKTK